MRPYLRYKCKLLGEVSSQTMGQRPMRIYLRTLVVQALLIERIFISIFVLFIECWIKISFSILTGQLDLFDLEILTY